MNNATDRPKPHRFDADFANRLAHLESYNKHLYRPNTYLHKWWARRCGSTFRLILKSLVTDANRLDYYVPGGLEGKIVLDPMMGGGTTLHEAIRLGANVVGYDVDPIPVLQAKATLSDVSLDSLQEGFNQILEVVESRLSGYFKSRCRYCDRLQPVRFFLYGSRQRCDCGESILVDSFILRRERNGGTVRLCQHCLEVTTAGKECDCDAKVGKPKLYDKSVKLCPDCEGKFRQVNDVPFYRRYHPLVSVVECDRHGLVFQTFSSGDGSLLARANKLRGQLDFDRATKVEPGPKSNDLLRHGIHDYQDVFSTRQLVYIRAAIAALQGLDQHTRTYLALLVSTSLEFNTMLCGYKGSGARRAGAVRHAFSHHAYSFPYTAIENNPVGNSATSGSLRRLFRDRVRRARVWALKPKERLLDSDGSKFEAIEGEVDIGVEVSDAGSLQQGTRRFHIKQGSAASMSLPEGSVDFVVTDPPYFDSVQYGNLSAYFRVWLRQMLGPEVANDLRWDYALSESAVDSGKNRDGSHYVNMMSSIFLECRRVLKPASGRLVFSFHHWRAEGWAAICVALKRAGFRLETFHIVHSENPISVHIANMNALTDDAILVLAGVSSDMALAWQLPGSIRTDESAAFCRDCAEAVGGILASSMSEAAIASWWKGRLEERARIEISEPPESK